MNDEIEIQQEDEDRELGEENADELGQKLKKLKTELQMCQKEKGEYLDGWQRAKADFINARKDEEKERREFEKFANIFLLQDFLAIADSLDMTSLHDAGEGARSIQRQLQELLKRHGVVPIESVGKSFDPAFHEAFEEIPVDDEAQNGVVIEELQKGYMLNGRVLRPAKAKVGNYKQ